MGRRERPIDPEAGPVQRFAFQLRQLRNRAGKPSYRELARRAHFSASVLSEAAGGEVLPSLPVALGYVKACGGDLAEWEAHWRRVADDLISDKAMPTSAGNDDAPYLGLETFQTADADRFFGRRQLIEELGSRLAGESFLAVFGPSGSGKSSVLRAGLLPLVQLAGIGDDQATLSLLMTPGERPLEELAARLAALQGGSAASVYADLIADASSVRLAARQALACQPIHVGLVIVIDQFEEVFTSCRDQRERSAFIDCLLAATDDTDKRVRIVIGVRADFYGHCADHPTLVAALRDRQVLVGPMEPESLREAIVEPARAMGYTVEAALVETIVAEAAGQPGALPLVSHALRETWKRRRAHALTLAGYRETGGMHGAISQSAESIYAQFDTQQQHTVKDLFLRLTSLGEGTEDTRRRAPRNELVHGPDHVTAISVLTRLADARLVTADEDSITVAHEALIRGWPRLREWLTEDRVVLRAHRRLTEAAVEWEQHRRDHSFLYHGIRLAAWDDREPQRLNHLEQEFLNRSRERERHRQVAVRRRVQIALGAMLTALILVGALAAVAVYQADQAALERDRARSDKLVAQSRAQLQLDPQLALLLAQQAWQTSRTPRADTALRQAVVDSRVRAIVPTGQGQVFGVAYSPDGRHVAAGGADGTVTVWEQGHSAKIGGVPRVLRGHRSEVWSPVFSPDSMQVAACGVDGTVTIWDLRANAEPMVLTGHTDKVWNVTFSPDGTRLASASGDGTVRVWDRANRHLPVVIRVGGQGRGVAFTADGHHVVASSNDGTVSTWKLTDNSRAHILRGPTQLAVNFALSRDGTRLATANPDGTVRIRDTSGTGDTTILRHPTSTAESVTFSPDGMQVASGGGDGTIRIWNINGNTDPVVLHGHRGPVWSLTFSPDGTRLASGSSDGTIHFWDPAFAGHPRILRGHRGAAWTLAMTRDEQIMASGGEDGILRIWAIGSDRPLFQRSGHTGEILGVAFSPDGRRVASTGQDGTVRLWSTTDARDATVLTGHGDKVWNAAFSPDGQRLVSGSSDGTVRIWDTTSQGHPTVLRGHDGAVRNVTFSPDGRRVASAGRDGTVRIWNADGTGDPTVLRGHDGGLVWSVAFSPDGGRLASGGHDGTARIWDTTGRRQPLVLGGHRGAIWHVTFSPDGKQLASSGHDSGLWIWDTTTGTELVIYHGHGATVESIAVGRDGHLVTAHDDGTVRVWRCDVCGTIEDVQALANTRIVRELTLEERTAYLE